MSSNSLHITKSGFEVTERLVPVEGNVGGASTGANIAATAIGKFGSIDGVVNNACVFFTKPFTDYTAHDFELLSATNMQGYTYLPQLAVKHMLAQKTRGSVICVTSAMVEHPIAGVKASIPMITKAGLEAITRSLAMECAKENIRFNASSRIVNMSILSEGFEKPVTDGRSLGCRRHCASHCLFDGNSSCYG